MSCVLCVGEILLYVWWIFDTVDDMLTVKSSFQMSVSC
jgi:hypothetical protein